MFDPNFILALTALHHQHLY